MKQEGVTILQKPPLVKSTPKGASPPPVPDSPIEDDDYYDQAAPEQGYEYQDAEEERGDYAAPEQGQGCDCRRAELGRLMWSWRGIRSISARSQMFSDPRTSYPQQMQLDSTLSLPPTPIPTTTSSTYSVSLRLRRIFPNVGIFNCCKLLICGTE